jgi:GT2 family glycosyltransferase
MQGLAASAPAVSVVMPVRNGARFLAAALDSVLGQTGVEFEVICIDDGSADGTWPILAQFADRFRNLRICRGEGSGISDALNQGLRLARGSLIARMDADDICRPGRLATQARWLDLHPSLGALGTQALLIDEADRACGKYRVPVGCRRVHNALATSSPIIHPTVMMRRDLVLAVGGYRRLFDGAEDYDLWLRLARRARIDNLPNAFLYYRRHTRQQTSALPFHHARLAALAVVAARLREQHRTDPTAGLESIAQWRAAFATLDCFAIEEVRLLTASRLSDNGGTLRASGAAYLRTACRSSRARTDASLRRRLALACVRHRLQMYRSGRRAAAVGAVFPDLLRWRGALIGASIRHASVLLPGF